jgi:diguanylate cyclase (GGDEF)-like protein
VAVVIVQWFPLLAAVTLFSVAIAVFAGAPRSPLIRAFVNFAIPQSLLAFMQWGYRHANTIAEAQAWIDAGAIWPLIPATIFALSLEIASMGKKRPSPLLRNSMLLPALVFTVLGFTAPSMQREALPTPYGFDVALRETALMYLALGWAFAVSLFVLIRMIVTLYRGDLRARRLSLAFLYGVGAVVIVNGILGIITTLVAPELPFLSTIGVLILTVVVGGAVVRHGVWEVAPQVSAGTVLSTMQDGVILVDENQIIRYINPAAVRLLRLPATLVGQAAQEAIPPAVLKERSSVSGEERTLNLRDGTQLRVSFSSAPVSSRFGGHVYVFRDLSERMRFQERLEHVAYHDILSGLANRDAFQEDLAQLVREPRRGSERDRTSVLLLLDLDRFKEVNDAYGHAAGDYVIVETARRVEAGIRAEDRVYRLDGDEFAVILRNLRYTRDAEGVAEKLRSDIAAPVRTAESVIEMASSIGYSVVLEGERPDEPLARADAALYEAKRRRAGVVSFQPGDLLPTTRRAAVHRRVREAVRRREIEWHFQPIVDGAGELIGAEALARLKDEEGNPISPAEFIPAAEEIGIIPEIGHLSRHAAADLLDAMGNPEDFHVTVNISPLEIKRDELVEQVLKDLRERNAFHAIHLEITETEMLELGPGGERRLEEMAAAGVQFYIDDFGSGYSSLSRLRHLPVTTVKVDRSFLLNWDDASNARELVQGTVRLITGLGMEVVAEGVEEGEHIEVLRSAGCTRFQGYYFHKPMPAQSLSELLRVVSLR